MKNDIKMIIGILEQCNKKFDGMKKFFETHITKTRETDKIHSKHKCS